MAPQHADIDVRVVRNQNVGIKRLSNFAFDVCEGWRCRLSELNLNYLPDLDVRSLR